ncbi:MAG: hypothetical protein JNM89_11415 [Hyphomicrobiaceae bacterium]|nr:hypothetical protein [Hyphomicrobiaceae bacterium]
MRRDALKFAAVIAALAVGVALKVGRYAERGDPGAVAAHDYVVRVMASYGWAPADGPPDEVRNLYAPMAFERAGCGDPVVVAVMGGNAEGAEFFRLQHDGDAAFIQQEVVARPSGFARHWDAIGGFWGKMTGAGSSSAMPVLAISPAPAAGNAGCGGPPVEAWHR